MNTNRKKRILATTAVIVCLMTAGIVAADRLGVPGIGLHSLRITQSAAGLEAESAVVLDAGSGEILFDKNSRVRMYPASTTKILTALLAIEAGCLNDKVVVGKEIYRVPSDGSKAGLRVGEKLSMKELLRGLLLPSGNDAAQTIAVHVARYRLKRRSMTIPEALGSFARLMNERAARCGAVESHFVNPDGYHHPGHYSTAYDMALISREAMKHAFFRQTVGMDSYKRPGIKMISAVASRPSPAHGGGRSVRGDKRSAVSGPPAVWENRNKLLDGNGHFGFAGATGIKTGHTDMAGWCLVASASRNGKDIISVVLNSTEKGVWTDSIGLLTYGFETGDRHAPERAESL